MLAEALSVHETGKLLDELSRFGIDARELVVNQLAPSRDCPVCANIAAQQARELERLPAQFAGRALWGVPWLAAGERTGVGLETFWRHTRRLDLRNPLRVQSVDLPVRVDGAAPLPVALRLLIFAGKGGVGKTTMACATAVRLASEQKRVLLFSTDPA